MPCTICHQYTSIWPNNDKKNRCCFLFVIDGNFLENDFKMTHPAQGACINSASN